MNIYAETMEGVRTFLESSTIHGLAHISVTSKNARLFWILVVIFGFTVSGIIINESFQAWDETPIKTMIETRPITEITFPKVTVCPPRNSFTDLNYDLLMVKDMTIGNKTRKELTDYAVNLLNKFYEVDSSIMTNLSMLEDNDRYYNWYHGYTKIKLPYYHSPDYGVVYIVYTSALYGNISTQFFNQKFMQNRVEKVFYYKIYVETPYDIVNNPNVTLHFNIEKMSMKYGEDRFYLKDLGFINVDKRYISQNFTSPENIYYVRLERKVRSDREL